jgi:hypothetical protein
MGVVVDLQASAFFVKVVVSIRTCESQLSKTTLRNFFDRKVTLSFRFV